MVCAERNTAVLSSAAVAACLTRERKKNNIKNAVRPLYPSSHTMLQPLVPLDASFPYSRFPSLCSKKSALGLTLLLNPLTTAGSFIPLTNSSGQAFAPPPLTTAWNLLTALSICSHVCSVSSLERVERRVLNSV